MAAVTPTEADRREPPSPRWSLTLVIAVVAVTVGYLFGASGTSPEAAPASSTTTSRGLTPTSTTTTSGVTTSEVAPSRLADMVPGFEGTLVVEVGSSVRNLVVWPAHMSSPSIRPVDVGSPFEFDPATHLPARLVRSATGLEHTLSTLLVGFHPIRVLGSGGLLISMGAVALDVRSFAWHSSEPGMLAWIEASADSTEDDVVLRVGSVGEYGVLVPSPPLATLPGPEAGYGSVSLLAWDTWGFLVSRIDEAGSPSLSLLAPDGSFAWSRPLADRVVLGAEVSATGDILLQQFDRMSGDSEVVLTDVSGSEPRVLDLEMSTTVIRLAPDGEHLAYFFGDGRGAEVVIRHVDGTVLQEVTFLNSRVWDLQWTPDGRFVLAPGELEPYGSGGHVVLFFDAEDGSSHVVRFDDWVNYSTVLMP